GLRHAAGVDRTHRLLRARLAGGLRRDDADRLADRVRLAVRKRSAVALLADAMPRAAVEDGADLDALGAASDDGVRVGVIHHLVLRNEHVAVLVAVILNEVAAHETLLHRLDGFAARLDLEDLEALGRAAVVLADDDLLRNVDETSGQVTGVRRTERRIGQALTRAAGGDEVFEDVQAFTVVGLDRDFDRLTGCVRDQAAHTGKLADLAHG